MFHPWTTNKTTMTHLRLLPGCNKQDDLDLCTLYVATSDTSIPSNQDKIDPNPTYVATVDDFYDVDNSSKAATDNCPQLIPQEVRDLHDDLNGKFWN